MLQSVLVLVLALIWMTTLTNVGGTDFLRVTVVKVGFNVIRAQDVLIGLVIACFIISTRGPMAWTGGAVLVLWAMSLFGLPQLFGVEVAPIFAIVIVVGACVHFVT